jgi:hypothetical protein
MPHSYGQLGWLPGLLLTALLACTTAWSGSLFSRLYAAAPGSGAGGGPAAGPAAGALAADRACRAASGLEPSTATAGAPFASVRPRAPSRARALIP